jgi:hypothetical protein
MSAFVPFQEFQSMNAAVGNTQLNRSQRHNIFDFSENENLPAAEETLLNSLDHEAIESLLSSSREILNYTQVNEFNFVGFSPLGSNHGRSSQLNATETPGVTWSNEFRDYDNSRGSTPNLGGSVRQRCLSRPHSVLDLDSSSSSALDVENGGVNEQTTSIFSPLKRVKILSSQFEENDNDASVLSVSCDNTTTTSFSSVVHVVSQSDPLTPLG